MYQPLQFDNAPLPPAEALPTMYDLPSEDPEESGLPDLFHLSQPRLLDDTFDALIGSPDEVFTASDLNLYYDARHPLWYKRPDWFLVLGVAASTQQCDLRLSYVIWQEAIAPFLVVELLSPGTEAEDLGKTLREVNQPPTKWQVYEQILRIPYYAVFDRYTLQFRLFQLVGTRYEEMVLEQQRHWFAELQLGLGVWSGAYGGITGEWLRWYDAAGNWLATATERAEQAKHQAEQAQHQAQQAQQRAEQATQQAEQEAQRAEQATQRAEQLAARLRALGVDPDQLEE
jgi:Uma2 family endonuclease